MPKLKPDIYIEKYFVAFSLLVFEKKVILLFAKKDTARKKQ